MQTNQYEIHLFLKTTSPLHIASPGAARLSLDTMQLVYGDQPKSIPCTIVQKMTVPTTDGTVNVPVIAANNIMGRLRRHAASAVLKALEGKGEKVSIQAYSALTCGAATGNPDGRNVTFDEYRETRAHPYIGLFGGGPRMMRRYVRCYNAVPYMDATRQMFERVMHPEMQNSNAGFTSLKPAQLLQRWTFRRNDDLLALRDMSEASASITDFEAEMLKRQSTILGQKATKKAGEEGDNAKHTTQTFSALEFVVPGTVFPLSFELEVSPAQLGLFLLALDAFSAKERIGGHARNGFGAFTMNDVVVVKKDAFDSESHKGVFNNSRLVPDHPFVADALAAWSVEADLMTGSDLDRLLSTPEEDKKGAKGKKKEATDATA